MSVFYEAFKILINIIEFLILIRILLSFVNIRLNNIIGEVIFTMTEPVLSPARNLISKLNIDTGMFDFSPIVAILILRVISNIVRNIVFM